MRLRWNKLFRYQSIRPPIPTVKTKDKDQEEDKSYTEERSIIQDIVNSPIHYNQAGIECIDAIAAALGDGFEYYLQGNVMKYLWRYRYKNGIEDLKKAEWYQSKLIEMKERK
tara:strand:- start:890 stop:1225 length:336 start_codon:yes stop_codon:yes gene_type:complete